MKKTISPPNMAHSYIRAFFTTKIADNVVKYLDKNGYSESMVYLPIQRHTDRVLILNSKPGPEVADAVITNRENVLLGVQVADCVPIVLLDEKKRVIGAVHAGWRGTAAQILKKTIQTMVEHFRSSPDNIIIAFGPSIKGCCYEVDSDVNEAVCISTGAGKYSSRKNSKFFIDLSSANMLQALSLGVKKDNIWVSEECTFCNPDRFHSYRYHGNHAGRQGGFIGIFSS
jgi:YfiH family protein